MLHADIRGEGGPVVLLHGFTQSARAWDSLADQLAPGHQMIALDAPGHGASAAVEADLLAGADLMAAAVGRPAMWVGYSMGGRYALHVALRHPALVARLVLVSATAGIDDPEERLARRRSDEALAERVLDEGVEPFVRWWLDQALFATLPDDARAIDARLGNTAAGLASSLRLAGTGTQEPLWGDLARLEMPVLAVAGALDAKYVAVARRLVDAVGPNARLAVMEGAGHACHLEQPSRFTDLVAPFLGA